MISRDSVLKRLPPNLDRKQALFIDGIRHAGEIADLAWGRLRHTLTRIALEQYEKDEEPTLTTSAFLDARSLVDVIDRFRALWKLLPNAAYTAPPPGYKSFADTPQAVRDLRNIADHLAQRADYVVASEGSALGVLSWYTATTPDGIKGLICAIVPGTIQPRSTQMINPAGTEFELPTGYIHLSAGEHRANLSAVLPEMARRIRQLEDGLASNLQKQSLEGQQAGADLIIRMIVEFE
jgi:hypothetical protein